MKVLPILSVTTSLMALIGGSTTLLGEEPAFRKLVEPTAYSEALSKYWERIEEAGRLAATDLPEAGTVISAVVPDSTAGRLGIGPGTILSSIGGDPASWYLQWKERSGPAEAVFATAEGKEFRHSVPPGLLGVNKMRYFRPELALIRSHPGSGEEAWYPHAVLGALAVEEDSALAETAWAMAMNLEYPEDLHSRYFEAAFAQKRPGLLGEALDRFLEGCDDPDGVPLWTQELICSLLAADGRIDAISRIMGQEGAFHYWSSEDVASLLVLSKQKKAASGQSDPLAYVNSRPFRILNTEVVTIDRLNAGFRESAGKPLFSTPIAILSRPAGYYGYTAFRSPDPVKNVHVRMDLNKLVPSGHHEKFVELAEIALISNPESVTRSRNDIVDSGNVLAQISVTYRSEKTDDVKVPYFTFRGSNLPSTWCMPAMPLSKSFPMRDGRMGHGFEKMVFDLFRIEDEMFVYINEAPYLRLPVSKDRDDVGVFFRCIGTQLYIKEFTFREYRP